MVAGSLRIASVRFGVWLLGKYRMNRSFTICVFALSCWSFGNACNAENWPGWRGPRGDGSSLDSEVVTSWDAETGKNIVWKTTTPGTGHASPIVWEDRVFLTACLPEEKTRVLICFDRKTGEQIWRKNVFRAPLESIHSLNSFASGTPVTDGELVYVAFLKVDGRTIPAPNVGSPRQITPGRIVVAAFDFSGELSWKKEIGDFISAHGFCSCPVLFEDLLIVNGDHDGDSYLVALDKQNGEERWRIDRENKIRSYVTPVIRKIDDRTQMVLSGSQHILSVDPHNGKTHWQIDGPTEQFVASMVYDGSLFFMTCGYPDYYVMGIKPTGTGNVTESHVAWESRAARAYVPSPVVLNGYLIVADDRGTANCFDAATGEQHWKARFGSGFNASLIHANGLVYMIAKDGKTKVVKPGKKVEIVAENELGEFVSASPAISHGQLFIRGEKSLFCIGNTSAN